MADEQDRPQTDGDDEEIGVGIDPIDPLKRDPDEGETMPGLDPVVSPLPPE
jgi:hypothetical protein